MTTDRLAALLAEVTTRANAVVREQDAIDFIDWCRDDLPAAAGVIVAQPATALKPCKTHGLDGHLYDCDAVRWVPYQPAPDALRESAHIVEQQGLALGRLREAARAVVDDSGVCCCRVCRCEAHAALRAALEEADRG